MLRPKCNIELNAAPIDGDLDSPGHDVFLPHSVEDDVDCANENLPHAVKAEEVTKDVEVPSLEGR